MIHESLGIYSTNSYAELLTDFLAMIKDGYGVNRTKKGVVHFENELSWSQGGQSATMIGHLLLVCNASQ